MISLYHFLCIDSNSFKLLWNKPTLISKYLHTTDFFRPVFPTISSSSHLDLLFIDFTICYILLFIPLLLWGVILLFITCFVASFWLDFILLLLLFLILTYSRLKKGPKKTETHKEDISKHTTSSVQNFGSWRYVEVCLCDVLMVLDNWPQLNVQTKPVEPLVEGGAQIQQVLNIECLTDFSDAPLLNIKFRWAHTTEPSPAMS